MKYLKNLDERIIVAVLLAFLFIFFLIISIMSEGTYGGADDISHYNISANAFRYPRLLLDLWGKPVFTLLTAPFAQFGMEGVKTFNILIGLLTCYYTYLIARIMKYRDSWLIILFICFAPLYTTMIVTGMTEILFGFALVFAAYQFYKERYILSSVIISFLPFIRNEGLIIIPVYLVAFGWYKKWKAVPFLFTGIVFLSFIGAIYYKDLIWIVHKWPYGDTSGIYGSGDFFFYVANASRILGIPLIILFIPGLFYCLFRFFTSFSLKPSPQLTELLLILGSLFIYTAGHSYAWYKGTVGSGGLIRFMTPTIPLATIYCLQGINLLTPPKFIYKWLKAGIYIFLLFFVFRTPFKIYTIPRRFSEPEKVTYTASKWLKKNALGAGKIYYFDPALQHYLDVNYHDQTLINQFLPDSENPGNKIPEGSFIAWDTHFGSESKVLLESLINSPSLRLIKVFKSEDYFLVQKKRYYNLFIFRKDSSLEKNYNSDLLNRLSFYDDDNLKQKVSVRNLPLDRDTITNIPDTVLDGRACIMLDTAETFSHTIRIMGNDVDPSFSRIRASINFYPVEPLMDGSCILALSINRKDKNLLFHTTVPFYLYNGPGMWNLIIVEAKLPKNMDGENEIRVYIMQNNHQEIYINDFTVELLK